MKKFLRKIKSENLGLRYLKFSEIDQCDCLDNHTRIHSLVVFNQFEVCCFKWSSMYINVFTALQKIKPFSKGFLIEMSPFIGRLNPFSDCMKDGYSKIEEDLYIRVPTSSNEIVLYIKCLLRIYGFNLNDCYLVIELNPNSIATNGKDIIEEEKNDLLKFLNRTYVKGNDYFSIAIEIINLLNSELSTNQSTSYNNLYLLSSYDYMKYSSIAINSAIAKRSTSFTQRQLELAVEWLRLSRFYNGDYFDISRNEYKAAYIEDGDRSIRIMYKTYFVNVEVNSNE